MRLRGKVCIVTGGGSGIGRATSQLFACEGARLVIADRNVAAAGTAAECARTAGGDAVALAVDVSKGDDVRRMVEETLEHFGRIDVLVNNAGYGIPGSVVETSEEDWDALMAVNLTGVFLCSKHAIPIMVRQGGGVIVNVASVVANVGITNRAAYCASKGGVAALTRAMALDHVADGIRVNAVAPGTINSPYFEWMLASSGNPEGLLHSLESRQAMRRLGKPEEIAHGILYLAGDESSFSTGSILTIDGGMTAQ